jgi:hypothetical protein
MVVQSLAKVTILALVMLTGCAGCITDTGKPNEPDPVVVPQEGKELCPQACQHMVDLSCAEGLPVPAPADIVACGGDAGCPELVECQADAGAKECVTCAWFCAYQHDNGVTWNTSCLLGIKACGEVESVCNK